jgi:predicted metal-dependent enzyme (double-stranded beta helix superfamily)
MFDLDRFTTDCRDAVEKDDSHKAVRELVTRAVEDQSALFAGLGEPTKAGGHKLYNDDKLTILNVIWAPGMTVMPHNHAMWAVIGVYTGREDNILWRRVPDAPSGLIEAAGARSLGPTDVAPLGKDIIHSVTNPLPRLTGAIHVYGGDFYGVDRSEWDPENLHEEPYDMARIMGLFEKANAA